MQTEIMLITPKKAEELLVLNANNRHLRDGYVNTLAAEMLAGRWRENTSETIKIAKTGMIIDGQHRLSAVVASGKSIRFLVATGLDERVMDVIDTGLKRTAGDVLNLKGVKNYNLTAAIIKSCLANTFREQSALSAGVTNRMVEDEYFKDSTFWDNAADHSQRWSRGFKAIPGSLFGYIYATILRKTARGNAQKAIPFLEGLSSGKDCPEIIIDLRNKLINNQLSKRKLTAVAKVDMIRSYWNAYIKGRKSNRDEKSEGWI
jgi:hypothetical protein